MGEDTNADENGRSVMMTDDVVVVIAMSNAARGVAEIIMLLSWVVPSRTIPPATHVIVHTVWGVR